MTDDLFSKPAEYTIDSSSLMAIFGDEPWTSKKITTGLWRNVSALIEQGIIISHEEVLLEIKKDEDKGEELFTWAHAHNQVFRPHDERGEGAVIRLMSTEFKDFVNRKLDHVYADPWLIAQAKHRGIKIISEERLSTSPHPKNWAIPNVCADSAFQVVCLDLWGLAKEQKWTFK
jgi:hypothetical protein